jgi:glycosyltransferase involved in cell wall biosynthesis
MLLMTLGVVFFFIGVFKNDKRFFKAILGCVLFDVVFWIIGDGNIKSELQNKMQQVPGLQYTFWGNIPPDKMPEYYNSMDLLVKMCYRLLTQGLDLISPPRP